MRAAAAVVVAVAAAAAVVVEFAVAAASEHIHYLASGPWAAPSDSFAGPSWDSPPWRSDLVTDANSMVTA